MNKKTKIAVTLGIIFAILAGGGIGYYIINRNTQAGQTNATQKIVSINDKYKKYTSSGLVSRSVIEYAEDLVRELKPKPPESARFYSFVATIYSDIYVVQKNSDHGLEAVRQVINQIYPEKNIDTDGFIASLVKSKSDLNEEEKKILTTILEREKTDGFRTIKWDEIIPKGIGKWTKKDINPFSPVAGQWKRWLVPENYDYQVPEPIKPENPLYDVQKKAVIQATANRGPNEVNDINYWGGGPGTEGPSGIWQDKMYETLKPLNLSDEEYSNTQKILAQSLADSFMEAWKVKYTYWTERPSMVISNLNLSMPDPIFPGYVSGHSTISRTAAEVLGVLYPNYKDVFLKNATTAKNSRLIAGVHFPMDNDEGFKLGEKVGKQVLYKLGKISLEDATSEKIGEGKMKTFVTDKSHDYNNPELKDRVGYLYKVSDTNPKPIATSLLSAENGDKLNGKDGFQFEQIGADPFWLPGACASLPSYKIDNKNLLTLVGKVDIDGNKTTDKYVVYNYDTKKFTYVYDSENNLQIGDIILNKDSMSYFYMPKESIKHPYPLIEKENYRTYFEGSYIIKRTVNIKTFEYKDLKIYLPNEVANSAGFLIIRLNDPNDIQNNNLHVLLLDKVKLDDARKYNGENTPNPYMEAGNRYYKFDKNGFIFTDVTRDPNDPVSNSISVNGQVITGEQPLYTVDADYQSSKIKILDKNKNIFTEVQLKKGLNNGFFNGEDDNYIRVDVSGGQIGSANTLYIDKTTKDVRILANQEYTVDTEGVNSPKYPIFNLGNIEP